MRVSVRVPLFGGLRPVRRARLGPDLLAGVTLAALAVPEVLGYAQIAGMPVVTGLYTMLAPVVVFAVLGSSRHLVIGADSATAAILAAGLAGSAAAGSPRYAALVGTATLVVAVLLVLAWAVRLGFLANFLSRTVLVGFLTGVGIEVATRQLPTMLGVPAAGRDTPQRLWLTLTALPAAHLPTVLVALAVVAVVVLGRLAGPRFPGPLLAVGAAIVASHLLGLGERGVALLGEVPSGLPGFTLPSLAPADLQEVLPVAASMLMVILAQSAATSRAYAARFDEQVDTDADLVGLAGANVAAALSGAFTVNGSPTKTQMVVSAGGRSQLAQLGAVVVVLLVCVLATGFLAALPLAALAAVVFVIGVELVDVKGMRGIRAVRRDEFVVAVLTALAVVVFGVEVGIVAAVVVSIIDHLRHSYHPRSSVLRKSPQGHWNSLAVTPGQRTVDGLVVYRFGTGLYFANAPQLSAEVARLATTGPPLRWFCLDCAAIGDVDYSAAATLRTVVAKLRAADLRVVVSNALDVLRAQLDGYGIRPDAYYDTAGQALEAFEAAQSG